MKKETTIPSAPTSADPAPSGETTTAGSPPVSGGSPTTTTSAPPSADPAPSGDVARQRRADLHEAAKIFGVDLGNSGDAIAQALESGHETQIAERLGLFNARLKRALELVDKTFPNIRPV